MILFALSLDLVLGYAGIVTLGHAAFFGAGAYAAGIFAAHVSRRAVVRPAGRRPRRRRGRIGVRAWSSCARTGLTLLMLTLAVAALLAEAANKASCITGGDDGLQGMEMRPIFGLFRFDMFGRTAYLYCLVVLFLRWLFARRLVHSPFGRSLIGIRENVARMHAIGAPVRRRLLIDLHDLGGAGRYRRRAARADHAIRRSELSRPRALRRIVIMLVFGGVGRLYGAFIGVAALHDRAGSACQSSTRCSGISGSGC